MYRDEMDHPSYLSSVVFLMSVAHESESTPDDFIHIATNNFIWFCL